MKYDLIPPGAKVLIGPSGDTVEGRVHSVEIGMGDVVRYLVCWWEDGDRIEDWLNDYEVTEALEDE